MGRGVFMSRAEAELMTSAEALDRNVTEIIPIKSKTRGRHALTLTRTNPPLLMVTDPPNNGPTQQSPP